MLWLMLRHGDFLQEFDHLECLKQTVQTYLWPKNPLSMQVLDSPNRVYPFSPSKRDT